MNDSNLLYLDSSADNIGIGDSSPSFKFDVAGTGRFTDALQVDSNLAIGATAFGTDAANVLAIANSTAPSTSITNGIQLFAVDEIGSYELQVRDEIGNVTTLSPHNFSILPDGLSEPYAWSYYSQRNGVAVSVDMTKALRLVENLSGEQLLYFKNLDTGAYLNEVDTAALNVALNPVVQEVDIREQLTNYVFKDLLKQFIEMNDQVWTFVGSVVFKAETTFQAAATFLGDVEFLGSVTVSGNTAGTVKIPAGVSAVKVEFEKPYSEPPKVYVTPVGQVGGYSVSNSSTTGFTIQLAAATDSEVTFNWLALLSQDSKAKATFEFDQATVVADEQAPAQIDQTLPIIPEISSEVAPEVAGTATESAKQTLATDSAGQAPTASQSTTEN
ncbi:MAG: hypothetical protein COU66_00300 [Candidatus Pacebacteria bacterium CG10_big_fil_rev_8_21_14_0_10_44_11]|nr:MAG: hypothetical protein COU66_00300 [Candidatus Pacebacteria bacterium CG10_big_fil_rev_8_21_14_0_10_44_11]